MQENIRIIQFGEGNFLRGFVDYFLFKLKEKKLCNSDVVVVQPLKYGMCKILKEQDCKYNLYLRGIQDDIITSKYLTGVIIKDIEDEILTRMYYNYLFEKIKRLKVRNEYITIKINGDIIKYIKGKEDNNLNKIKELYYIKEIKIQNENDNKIGKKLEIVLDNEKD